MAEPEYIFETHASLDGYRTSLEAQAKQAIEEAAQARTVEGLAGPARAAEAQAQRLDAELADLTQIGQRIDKGYSYWEREGFEDALDACGVAWTWHTLSEILSAELVFGHDDVDVRLPVETQRAYERALGTGLFDRFEICSAFETEGDEAVEGRHYLFGIRNLVTRSTATFLIDQW